MTQGLFRLGGRDRPEDGEALAAKVAGLSRHQAWALFIAVEFWVRYRQHLDEGAPWWRWSVRHETLRRVKKWPVAEGDEGAE